MLLGFAFSIVSPPIIVFVIIDFTEGERCCGGTELLLLLVSALELLKSHTGISLGMAGKVRRRVTSDALEKIIREAQDMVIGLESSHPVNTAVEFVLIIYKMSGPPRGSNDPQVRGAGTICRYHKTTSRIPRRFFNGA